MGLKLNGATSGSIEIDVPAVAGTDTAITIPATTGGEFIVSDSSGNIDLGPLDINGSASDDSVNIDSSGRLLVSTSTARSNVNHRGTTGIAPNVQFETATGSYSGGLSIINNSSAGYAATLTLGVSHGTTIGSNTIGSNNSQTGTISFSSSDGTNFIDCAQIRAELDETPGTDDMPGRLLFSTTANGASSPTERMRITNGGNLCINSTGSDNSTGGPLCITGRSAQGMSTWNIGQNGFPALYFNNASGTKVGDIVVNSGSTAYNTSSDYRLKENVVDLDGAITRVKQLAPKRFNFIADADTTVDGFLAHEAAAVVPEAVTGEKDAVDADGNPEYQGIDQSKLVPLLTAALQEAIGKIETLEAKVAQLEGGAA